MGNDKFLKLVADEGGTTKRANDPELGAFPKGRRQSLPGKGQVPTSFYRVEGTSSLV